MPSSSSASIYEFIFICLFFCVLLFSSVSALTYKIAVVTDNPAVSDEIIYNVISRRINSNWRLFPTSTDKLSVEIVRGQNCSTTTIISQVCAVSNLYGVLAVGSCGLLNQLQSLATSLQIPSISIPIDFCHILPISEFNFIGSTDHYHQLNAVSKIIEVQKLTKALLLYDSQQELKYVEYLQETLSRKFVTTLTVKIDFSFGINTTTLGNIFTSFFSNEIQEYSGVIIVQPQNLKQLLQLLNSTNWQQSRIFWIILDTGISPSLIQPSITNSANILLLRTESNGLLGQDSPCPTAVSDIFSSCVAQNITSFELRIVEALEAFGTVFSAMLSMTGISQSNASCVPLKAWDNGPNATFILNNFKNYSDNSQIFFEVNSTSRHFNGRYLETVGPYSGGIKSNHFYETSQYFLDSNLKILKTFNSENRYPFPNTFRGFKNEVLTVCAPNTPIISLYTKVNTDGTVQIVGILKDFLDALSGSMNFRYIVVPPPDGEYGAPVAGQKYWSGCVGEIQQKKAHLAGLFALVSLRSLVIDSSIALAESGSGILVKRPPPLSKFWNVFEPFSVYTWGLIIGTIFLVSILTFMLAYFSPFSAWNLQLEYAIADEIWLQEYFWTVLGSFLQQGQDFYPFALSPRTLLAFWWMFTVVMFGAYTADLTAHLTVTITQYPIQSLSDLVDHPDYAIYIPKATNTELLFRTSNEAVYVSLRSRLIATATVADCMKRLLSSEFAYAVCITDSTFLKSMENIYCDRVYFAKEEFYKYSFSLIYPKGAYYQVSFNEHIRRSLMIGVVNHVKIKHLNANDYDCKSNENIQTEANSLGLDSIAGACIITGSLYVCGFVILLLEFCWTRMLKREPLDLYIY